MTDEEYQQRLAAAKAKKTEAEGRLNEKLEAARRLREVEDLERAAEDAEAREKAIDAHGADGVATYDTPLGVVIVKRPDAMIFRRFQGKTKVKPDDVEALVQHCLVHPAKPRFGQIAETYPGVPMEAAGLVLDLVKARGGELKGKS